MKQPESTTETKKATFNTEEVLCASETTFKAIFEHSLDGILVVNAKSKKFILANPAMQTITGYTPAELTKLSVDDIHPSKDLASILDKFNQLARKEIRSAKDVPILHKNQNIIYCDITGGIMKLNSHNYLIRIFRDITEQRQTEAALRESEARYRSLFENTYSGVAVYEAVNDGKDFIFKDFNTAGEKIDQAERTAVIGKKVTEAFPGVKKFGLFKIFQKVWRTGKTEYLPPAFYQDKRESGWRENWVYKLPNGEIVAIYNDVTASKQIKENLRASEARLQSIFESAPIGLFEFDFSCAHQYLQQLPISSNENLADYFINNPKQLKTAITKVKIVTMNQAALEFSGATNKDKFVKAIPKFFIADTLQEISQLFIAIYNGHTKCEIKTSILTMCGEKRHILARYVVSPGHETQYDRVIMTIVDITEQMQMNEKLESIVLERTAELQESEQRYRMLASISPVGIFHLDAAGNCLYANQKFSEITGLIAAQAYVNGGWEKAIHADDLEKVRQKWFASARSNQPFTMEYRFRKPNGKITWVLSHTIAIINEQQQTLGYVGTFTNITEHREAETKLRLQKLQLARHERASAMSEVATSLAHQLNQPLTVISSYAQMLQNCKVCSQSCGIAQKMVTSAKKASDIIRNLRAFFSNGTTDKSSVNINQLISDSVELLTHNRLYVKPITFDFCQPNPILLLDKIQIEQVINNIVENAIEALTNTNQSAAKIKINTDAKEEILTVTVEDNGIGFASHVADKLFEPFFSTKPRGTGIGLTICHSIIEAHGGKLYANSQLGQGAKFWFTLPIINQEG